MGRYELVRLLGGGGFASVWLARSAGLGGFERMAAIKVIRPGRAKDKRFQDMLLDEARLVARINHPAVAQIWEVGEDPRSLYFVMELVDGDSLDELRYRAESAGASLPVRAVFRVLADICGGLHAAHELRDGDSPVGLVHRDVSPQNILVSRLGNAKLIDFGIAKAKERLAKDTTSGFIKGKVIYMAPEQARAERDVDRRVDVWAIGAVAYEVVEGRPPIEAQTDIGRLATLVGPDPVAPMTELMPAPLREVVARALEKDKDRRYATALELKEAIEEALITAELETSEHDVAELFAPWFPRPRSDAPPATATESATEGNSGPTASPSPTDQAGKAPPAEARGAPTDERPVSSTVQVPAQVTETLTIPKERPRYALLVVAGLLLGAPILWWAATRPGPDPSVTSAQPTTTAIDVAPGEALPPAAPETSSSGRAAAPPTSATSTSASSPTSASSASASRVQAPRAPRTARPAASPPPSRPASKPTAMPDDNAIE